VETCEDTRTGVLTAESVNIAIFCDLMPCSLVHRHQHSGAICYFHLQARTNAHIFTKTTQSLIPEEFKRFHSFIHQRLYSPLLGPALFFSFVIFFTQSVRLVGREISRLKAATYTQDNTNTDIHALSGIRTHDPSVRAREDSSCLRPRAATVIGSKGSICIKFPIKFVLVFLIRACYM
jgi:hypothetical protein